MALRLTTMRVMDDEDNKDKRTDLSGVDRLKAMKEEQEDVPQPAANRNEPETEPTGVARLQALKNGQKQTTVTPPPETPAPEAQQGRLRPGWDTADAAKAQEQAEKENRPFFSALEAGIDNINQAKDAAGVDADALREDLTRLSAERDSADTALQEIVDPWNRANVAAQTYRSQVEKYETKLGMLADTIANSEDPEERRRAQQESQALDLYYQKAKRAAERYGSEYDSLNTQFQQLASQRKRAGYDLQAGLQQYNTLLSLGDKRAAKFEQEAQELRGKAEAAYRSGMPSWEYIRQAEAAEDRAARERNNYAEYLYGTKGEGYANRYLQGIEAGNRKKEEAANFIGKVLNTAGGAALNFTSGVGSTLITMARIMELPDDFLYWVTKDERFNLDREPYLRNSTALQASDTFREEAERMKGNAGNLGSKIIDVSYAAGNMMGASAFAGQALGAIGNSGAIANLESIANSSPLLTSRAARYGARLGAGVLKEIVSNPGNFGVAASSAVNNYSTALANGATFEQAMSNGLQKGVLEYLSNKMFSGTPFVDAPGQQGYVTKLLEYAAGKLGKSGALAKFNASTGGKVLNWFFDKSGEGLEEMITAIGDPLIDRITYDRDADLATADELVDEYIGGVLLSLLMTGGEKILTGSEALRENRQISDFLVENWGMSKAEADKYAPKLRKAIQATEEANQAAAAIQRAEEADRRARGETTPAAEGAGITEATEAAPMEAAANENAPPVPGAVQESGPPELGEAQGTAAETEETAQETETVLQTAVENRTETAESPTGRARLEAAMASEGQAETTAAQAPGEANAEAAGEKVTQRTLASERQKTAEKAASLRDAGFTTAGEDATAKIRSEESWDAEEKAVGQALRDLGYEPTFAVGLIENGEGKSVPYLLEGNKLAVRSDHRNQSVQEIAEKAVGQALNIDQGVRNRVMETITQARAEAKAARQAGKKAAEQPAVSARAQATMESARAAGASEEDGTLAGRLADIIGRDIRFFNEAGQNGAWKNGYTQNGVIYVNAQAKKTVAWVVGHELTHNVEHSKIYDSLKKLAKKDMGLNWGLRVQSRLDASARIAQKLGDDSVRLTDPADAEREIVADFFADRLLTDEASIRAVCEYEPVTARSIRDYIKNLLRKLGGKESTLERALTLYNKALKDVAAKAQADAEGRMRIKGTEAQKQESGPRLGGERQYSAEDDKYLAAVEAGDMETAQRMVDEAAKQAGYEALQLYHGSENIGKNQDGRAFSKFDMDASQGEIFMTDSIDVAESYTPNTTIRHPGQTIRNKAAETERKQKQQKIQRWMQKWLDIFDGKTTGNKYEIAAINDAILSGDKSYDSIHKWLKRWANSTEFGQKVQYDWFDAGVDLLNQTTSELKIMMEADPEFPEELMRYDTWETPKKERPGGVYQVYAMMNKPLIIEGSGKSWNKLDTPYGNTTREVTNYAKNHDYDSVIFYEIDDVGPATMWASLAEGEDWEGPPDPGNVYVVFDAGQIKSSDPVVYDDAGKPIPLSERFNRVNEDIRYSAEDSDDEYRKAPGTEALDKLGIRLAGSKGKYHLAEQLLERDKAAKELMKATKKAEKKLKATKAEREFAAGIAAGVYEERDIPSSMNKDTVATLADYYAAEESFKANMLAEVRGKINAEYQDEAEELLSNVDHFKKLSMLMLNERTPDRSFRAMFGPTQGKEIFDWLIRPVQMNEAAKTRWHQEQLDKVRQFEDGKGKTRALTRAESELTMLVMEGKAAAAAVADMEKKGLDAKGIQNAAENIRNGEDAADAAWEFGLKDKERELAKNYARWMDTQDKLKNADSTIIENAAEAYSKIFDEYYDAINDFLVAHGYEPIGYIKGYAPHMQPEETQSLLEKAFDKMGISLGNDKAQGLPASIAGETAYFKPNKRWDPYFLHRTGTQAEYDIEKAYQSYVGYLSDILFHTDDIMRVRNMERMIRKTYASDEIKGNLDWIQEIRNSPSEERLGMLRDAGKIGKTTILSGSEVNDKLDEWEEEEFNALKEDRNYDNLVTWLKNYANILAGKQSMADRGWEYSLGRNSLNFANRLQAAFQRSLVAGSLTSALNQTAQLPMIKAELGDRWYYAALKDIITGQTRGFWKDSDFLTGKHGVDMLYTDNYDKFISTLFKPSTAVDNIVSTIAVRGAFLKAIHQGQSYSEAMRTADDFGRSVMGSREKGTRPLAYESKGLFSRMIHMFQVEAANSWDHIASDLPYEIKEIARTQGKPKAARTLAALLLRGLLSAFVLNRLTEELYGGTPAPFDVIGLAMNFVASGQGMTTNRYLKTIIDNGLEKMGKDRLFGTEDVDAEFDVGKGLEELGYNVMNDVPLLRNLAGVLGLGDQTVPLPGAGGEFKDMYDAAKDLIQNGNEGKQVENLIRATLKFGFQLFPAGRQLTKTGEGVEAVIRGGSYNKKGNLQYPIDDTADKVKAILFGKNATNAARDHWASGEGTLSEKQTALVKTMREWGVSGADAVKIVRKISKIKQAGGSQKEAVVGYIGGLALTSEQKDQIYLAQNYAESGLDETPWHAKGGSSGRGKTYSMGGLRLPTPERREPISSGLRLQSTPAARPSGGGLRLK